MISSNYTRITFKTVLNSGMDNSLSYRMNFKFYKFRVITSQKLLKKKKKHLTTSLKELTGNTKLLEKASLSFTDTKLHV